MKNNLRSSRLEVMREITKFRLFYFFLDGSNSSCFREPRSTRTIMWTLIYHWIGIAERWRKNEFFNKWFWVNWLSIWKKMKLESCLTKRKEKISSELKNSMLKNKTIKLWEDNIGKYFYSIEVGKDSFNKVTKNATLINLTLLKFRTLVHRSIL